MRDGLRPAEVDVTRGAASCRCSGSFVPCERFTLQNCGFWEGALELDELLNLAAQPNRQLPQAKAGIAFQSSRQ